MQQLNKCKSNSFKSTPRNCFHTFYFKYQNNSAYFLLLLQLSAFVHSSLNATYSLAFYTHTHTHSLFNAHEIDFLVLVQSEILHDDDVRMRNRKH